MSGVRFRPRRELPRGLIFEIAEKNGLAIKMRGDEKANLRCPFHDDSSPSAVLFASNNFYCSGCGLKLTAKEFSERLGQKWDPPRDHTKSPVARPRKNSNPPPPPFTAADAERTWKLARARVRQDEPDPADREVYAYLQRRGLAPAFDEDVYGIVAAGMALHPAVAFWPGTGHRLVVPLYRHDGCVASLQARAIRAAPRKVLFPARSHVAGSVFANEAGVALLSGAQSSDQPIALVEGLTDFLAMCVVNSMPILGAPGTPFFLGSIGPWCRGRVVLLAPDQDEAGDKVLRQAAAAGYRHGAAEVFRLRWPSGTKDANDALMKVGAADIQRAIDRSMRREAGL
jgi:hypothetical protein